MVFLLGIAYSCCTIAYCTIADVPIVVVLLQPCPLLFYCCFCIAAVLLQLYPLLYYCSHAYYCTIAAVPINVLLYPCLLLCYSTIQSQVLYFRFNCNTLLLLFLHVHIFAVPPTDWACSPSATRVTSSQPRAGQAGLPLNLFIPCHPRFPK